ELCQVFYEILTRSISSFGEDKFRTDRRTGEGGRKIVKNRYRKWLHCLAPLGAAVLLWQMVSGGETVLPQMITYAAPGYDQAASSSSEKAIGKYGMTPIYAADIQDGTYEVKVESSSSFFRIQSARLTVKDGTMQAVLTMDSSS
ncbi:MAG: hypothetical protein PHE06_16510, partial [Lachnospiraceae bacterium]|nr:hypothetical protein [Lachnospiraceae bacterium]